MASPQDTAIGKREKAEIALDGIDFETLRIADPVPLGRQLLAEAGHRPPEAFSLYAILADGSFEDVRLDEPFDLRAKGTEHFIAFTGDRIFRFFANDREIKWGPAVVSEAELRFLAGAANDEAVFLEVRGGTDEIVAEGASVDLTRPGIERFITAKRAKTYHFLVNGTRYDTDQRHLTGLQIKARVPDWDPGHDLVLEGHGNDPDRPVADDEAINLDVKPARRFSSVPKANFG